MADLIDPYESSNIVDPYEAPKKSSNALRDWIDEHGIPVVRPVRKLVEDVGSVALPFAENLTQQAVGGASAIAGAGVGAGNYLKTLLETGDIDKSGRAFRSAMEDTSKDISGLYKPQTELGKKSFEYSMKPIEALTGLAREGEQDVATSLGLSKSANAPFETAAEFAAVGKGFEGGNFARTLVRRALEKKGIKFGEQAPTKAKVVEDLKEAEDTEMARRAISPELVDPYEQAAKEVNLDRVTPVGETVEWTDPYESAVQERSQNDLLAENKTEPVDYSAQAKEHGVFFNGMQERVGGKAPIPLFTDPVTETTFAVTEGETLPEAIARKREQFKIYEESKPRLEEKLQDEGWAAESDVTKQPAPTFYSKLINSVKNLTEQMPAKAQSVVGWLLKNQVKPEELKWMGVEQWLKDNAKDGKIDREKFFEFLKSNEIEIEEITKGDFKSLDEAKAKEVWNSTRRPDETIWDGLSLEKKQDFMRGAGLAVGEPSKFSSYTLPGGENYRELLLRLPSKINVLTKDILDKKFEEFYKSYYDNYMSSGWADRDAAMTAHGDATGMLDKWRDAQESSDFRSSHWDEPNVLGHIRMKDYIDSEGKRVLLLEEVQSDWHQAGKERGYKQELSSLEKAKLQLLKVKYDNKTLTSSEATEYAALRSKEMSLEQVPDAPFKDSWHELLMKRMLRYAAENGYEKLAWTTGKQQAERYDLAKYLTEVTAKKFDDGYEINFVTKQGDRHTIQRPLLEKDLVDEVGKDLANKIVSDLKDKRIGSKTYTGLDLKVGGEGMEVFYDKKIPGFMEKYVKQWESKVGKSSIDTGSYLTNEWEYKGPEPTVEKFESSLRTIRDAWNSKNRTPEGWRNWNVTLDARAKEVLTAMKAGDSFKQAIEKYGSADLAEKVGGEMTEVQTPQPTSVHSVDITPSMIQEVVYKGQTFFTDPFGLQASASWMSRGSRAVKEFFQDLTAAKMIVEPYDPVTFGDRIPERQEVGIPEEKPSLTPMGWFKQKIKDVSKSAPLLSPHTIFSPRFKLWDRPDIDAVKSNMAGVENTRNAVAFVDHTLRNIKDSFSDILEAVKPLFEKNKDLLNDMEEINSERAGLRRRLGKIPESSAYESLQRQTSKLARERQKTQDLLDKKDSPEARDKFLIDKEDRIKRAQEKIDALSQEHAKIRREEVLKVLEKIKEDTFDKSITDQMNKVKRIDKAINLRSEKMRELETTFQRIPEYNDLKNQIAALDAKEKSIMIQPRMKQMSADHTALLTDLAKKYADARVYLHAADELPEGITLTPEELKAANQLRKYQEATRDKLEDLGIPVIKERGYMTHLWQQLLADDTTNSIIGKFQQKPTLLAFMSRLPGSRTWIPSAHEAMRSYVPVAEYKIAYQPFLDRWRPFVDSIKEPGLHKYMDDWISTNMSRKDIGPWETLLNMGVGFEYARTIGLSLSVGTKHGMKLLGTPAEYGMKALEAIPQMAVVPYQAAMQFGKLHFEDFRKIADKLGVGEKNEQLLLFRHYITQSDLVRMMTEIPDLDAMDRSIFSGSVGKAATKVAGKFVGEARAREIGRSTFGTVDSAVNTIGRILAQPVKTVEALENGVSVFAGIIAGKSKGIDPLTIERRIWEAILDVNFRAGWDQPLMQRQSVLGRAITMFQTTPLKLQERLYKWVHDSVAVGKDPETGEMTIGKRDAFGTHSGAKLARFLLMVGAAEVIARQNDTSVLGMAMAHLPVVGEVFEPSKEGIGFKMKDIKPMAAPPIQWLYQMSQKGVYEGSKEHLKGGFNFLSKIDKAATEEYPTKYDSATKYMFGLPRVSGENDLETVMERQRKERKDQAENLDDLAAKFGRGDKESAKKALEYIKTQPEEEHEHLAGRFIHTAEMHATEHHKWWQGMASLSPENKAKVFYNKFKDADKETQLQLLKDAKGMTGFMSERFDVALGKEIDAHPIVPDKKSQHDLSGKMNSFSIINFLKGNQVEGRELGGKVKAGQTVEVGEVEPEVWVSESGTTQVVGKDSPELFTPTESGEILPIIDPYSGGSSKVTPRESRNTKLEVNHPYWKESRTGYYPKEAIKQTDRDWIKYAKDKGISRELWHGTVVAESAYGKGHPGLYQANFENDWQYLKPFIDEYKKSGDYKYNKDTMGEWETTEDKDYNLDTENNKATNPKQANAFFDWFSQKYGSIDPHYSAYLLSKSLEKSKGNESNAAREYNRKDFVPRETIPALGKDILKNAYVQQVIREHSPDF